MKTGEMIIFTSKLIGKYDPVKLKTLVKREFVGLENANSVIKNLELSRDERVIVI